MAGEGFIDPLGQVAQILGVGRSRPGENGAAKSQGGGSTASRDAAQPAAQVHLSHSGPALARLAERLRAVGFVHDPSKAFGETQYEGLEKAEAADKSGEDVELISEAKKADKKAWKEKGSDKPPGDSPGPDGKELTDKEREKVRELKERDREVRAHEMAHKAAAGELAPSGPYYEYETGPDGQDYAVGGHVPIRIPASDDPQETLANAEQARRAALAPAEPSPADRAVAQEATQMAAQARAQIAAEAEQEREDKAPAAQEPMLSSSGLTHESDPTSETTDEDENDDRVIEASEHPEFLLGQSFGLSSDPTNRT